MYSWSPSSWPALFDKKGVPRIAFQGDIEAERFGLQIQSADEKTQAQLVTDKGYNTLYLFDHKAVSRIALGVDPIGVPVLVFWDRNGKCRLQIQESAADLPSIALYDQSENCRLSIELAGDGVPSIRFFDAIGRIQFGLTVSPEGTPVVELWNPESDEPEEFEWNFGGFGLTKRSLERREN